MCEMVTMSLHNEMFDKTVHSCSFHFYRLLLLLFFISLQLQEGIEVSNAWLVSCSSFNLSLPGHMGKAAESVKQFCLILHLIRTAL